jgi:NTP pyrophosphatase (non-canonical NTP hydrolase)
VQINSSNYVEKAMRTYSNDYDAIRSRLMDDKTIDLLHASMGLCTEAGEFTDMLKKYIFYGRELDEINLLEELGDDFWYAALAIHRLKSKMDSVMSRNIQKLAKRYPDKFTEVSALNRDLEAEREI